MKRRQNVFTCHQCGGRVLSAGPDFWQYCDHNQPPRKSRVEVAVNRVLLTRQAYEEAERELELAQLADARAEREKKAVSLEQ